jgi:hypothetical protein
MLKSSLTDNKTSILHKDQSVNSVQVDTCACENRTEDTSTAYCVGKTKGFLMSQQVVQIVITALQMVKSIFSVISCSYFTTCARSITYFFFWFLENHSTLS